jgi:hypothetical protein
MSETEDRLYGLMEVVERQQAAVQAALEGLAVERVALQREREKLARGVQGLEAGARTAVQLAVTESLSSVGPTIAAKVEGATQALEGAVSGAASTAHQARAAMQEVVLWASWRLLGWIVTVAMALVLLGWLTSAAVLWWDTGTIAAAQLEKAQLQTAVAELKANYDGWVEAGMLGKLITCGPKARLCVRVDESAGAFVSEGHDDYRIIHLP